MFNVRNNPIGTSTSGYPSHLDIIGGLPTTWSDIILTSYGDTVLGARLAQARIPEAEGIAQSKAFHYLADTGVGDMDFFAGDIDEEPEIMRVSPYEDRILTVCQGIQLKDKFAKKEAYLAGKRLPMIKDKMRKHFREFLAKKLDSNLIANILAGAAPYNQGKNAGKKTGMFNLGSQDTNALTINNGSELINLLSKMIAVGEEVGMFNGSADVVLDDITSGDNVIPYNKNIRPIVLIPQALSVVARDAQRLMSATCQDCSYVLQYNGSVGRFWNLDVLTTSHLHPVPIGANASQGYTVPIVMIDPNYVWSFFDVISNGSIEQLFHWLYGVEAIYDSAVLNPDAVIIADVKFTGA